MEKVRRCTPGVVSTQLGFQRQGAHTPAARSHPLFPRRWGGQGGGKNSAPAPKEERGRSIFTGADRPYLPPRGLLEGVGGAELPPFFLPPLLLLRPSELLQDQPPIITTTTVLQFFKLFRNLPSMTWLARKDARRGGGFN